MAKLKPQSKSLWMVTVQGIQTYFQTFSGINEKREVGRYNDGLDNRVRKVLGNIEADAVTLGAPTVAEEVGALVDLFKACQEDEGLTVTITPVKVCKENERRGNKSLTLHGCQLSGLKGFEVDRTSSDTSMIELSLEYDYSSFA